MALPEPPVVPHTGNPPTAYAAHRIYIIDPLFAGSNKVYLVEPTHAGGRVALIPVSDIARDVGTIMVQAITQTYFQENILDFLPYEFWRMDAKTLEEGGGEGALNALTQVFAITLDEIKQAIDELPLILDIDHCPPQYLRAIAEMLNFPLEDVDNTAEQRRQLRTAIDWYKGKGSRKAFRAILYAFGFHTDMVPLWTEDYAVFTETIPGVASGLEPPNDFPLLKENGGTWYRSPHYGIRLQGVVGDRHYTIVWGATPQLLIDEYEALAVTIGEHDAWYEMVDELSAAGALLSLHFDTPDYNYLYRRIEFCRPVFAVLEWLEFLIEMQEQVDDPVEPVCIMTANPVRDDKGWYLGYCDQDDIQYTRLDTRLLGANPLALVTPLSGSPSVTSVVDEVTASITSVGETHVSGTLNNFWVFSDISFTATIGGAPADIVDTEDLLNYEVIDNDNPDGIETSFTGYLVQSPLTTPSVDELEVDYGLGVTNVSITDDGAGGLTGTGVTGTIVYSTGQYSLTFVTPPAAGTQLALYYYFENTEGVLTGEGILGVIDYLTGAWWMDFEVGYEPDNATDIVVDYRYTEDIPPCDRSGLRPRGSTELPFPHVRDPQEGVCHPPEDLDILWQFIDDEQYILPLTRDGMNLYPPAGPVPFIDRADFPSRGFTNALSEAGHANTLTREFGYATRPLSVLKVEQNPSGEIAWEAQGDNWEAQNDDWDVWGA